MKTGQVLRIAILVVACTVALGFAHARATPGPVRSPSSRPVVVASFDFAESVILAQMYAIALRATGTPVRLELRLGPRELVQPALRQHLVDVIPEYTGTALEASASGSEVDRHAEDAVRAELAAALRSANLQVLEPARAQNQNAFVMTRVDAERSGIHTVSDLTRLPRGIVVGGPPECTRRPYCLLGLKRVYGLDIRRFVAVHGQSQALAALEDDIVDVAVLFSTDGALADADLTALVDDRNLQPAEQIVPVVSDRAIDRYGPRMIDVLNAVSARLTSEALRFLNWRVTFAGKRPRAEARGWLERQGLLEPTR